MARVAQAVRDRREKLGLTLRALAARSGVSPSMISDIERQSKSPTISTLAALAEALEVSLAALVDVAPPGAAPIHVERAAEHSSATDAVSGATRERIGPALADGKVQILRYALPPRCVAGPFPAHASGTLEHVYLAEGSIRVVLGADAVTLEAGDSCTCQSDRPHSFDNSAGDTAALIYLVVEPPAPGGRRRHRWIGRRGCRGFACRPAG
jgi:transcriptional regulator with XRE-family HTH domain